MSPDFSCPSNTGPQNTSAHEESGLAEPPPDQVTVPVDLANSVEWNPAPLPGIVDELEYPAIPLRECDHTERYVVGRVVEAVAVRQLEITLAEFRIMPDTREELMDRDHGSGPPHGPLALIFTGGSSALNNTMLSADGRPVKVAAAYECNWNGRLLLWTARRLPRRNVRRLGSVWIIRGRPNARAAQLLTTVGWPTQSRTI